MVFLPCGHLATCVSCAPTLTNCPVCRSHIQATVRTFLSWYPAPILKNMYNIQYMHMQIFYELYFEKYDKGMEMDNSWWNEWIWIWYCLSFAPIEIILSPNITSQNWPGFSISKLCKLVLSNNKPFVVLTPQMLSNYQRLQIHCAMCRAANEMKIDISSVNSKCQQLGLWIQSESHVGLVTTKAIGKGRNPREGFSPVVYFMAFIAICNLSCWCSLDRWRLFRRGRSNCRKPVQAMTMANLDLHNFCLLNWSIFFRRID